MLITLKTLQQKTFKVEIDDSLTVKFLKEKIEAETGKDFPASGQKLIYAGKILNDDTQIKDYKIDDKSFVVVMLTKPKPAAKTTEPTKPETPTAAPTTSASDPSPAPATETKPSEKPPETKKEDAPATTTSSSSTTTSTGEESSGSLNTAESMLVTGSDFDRIVEEIILMGFPRNQVERALLASFNNPDRAVEYLMTEIPQRIEPPPQQVESGGTEGENPLRFLEENPTFIHMREAIQANPAMLNTLLQQLGDTNPQLLQLISANQEQFIAMLNEGVTSGRVGGQPGGLSLGDVQPSGQTSVQPSGQSAGPAGGPTGLDMGAQLGGQAGGEAPPHGVHYITLTQNERQAVERLKELGFPEAMVIQVYFACEKNEILAANFLLGGDDQEQERN